MKDDKMLLTSEEKNIIQKYQQEIDNILMSIGIIRRQFVLSENNLLKKINDIESDLKSYLNILAKNRNMPDGEIWAFDPNTYGFIKRES